MSEGLLLTCIGSGDAFGSGGRLNSCYHLESGQSRILLDCGCSSLIGLQRCKLTPEELDGVVVSHLHGDHFGGLPFLLLEAKFISQRQRPLTLIGPPGLQQQVEAAMKALYPGVISKELDFPLHYRTLDPRIPQQLGDFRLSCWQVVHGSHPEVFALRVEAGGKVLSYTGDTEWTENLIPLATDADLLIAECSAYAQAVPSHLDYQTLKNRRRELACRRLVLTHAGPEVLERRQELELELLDDGQQIAL